MVFHIMLDEVYFSLLKVPMWDVMEMGSSDVKGESQSIDVKDKHTSAQPC